MAKINKQFSIFVLLIFLFSYFSTAFAQINSVSAQSSSNIIKNVQFEKTDMNHAENNQITVTFGGPGTRVVAGQQVDITFNVERVDLRLPGAPIPLKNNKGVNLGEVRFSGNKASIIFNQSTSELDDVEGSFYFNLSAYYNGPMDSDGMGRISVEFEGGRQDITVNYRKGSTSPTKNVYSKKGVATQEENSYRNVDWVFTFNAARNASNGDVSFTVNDPLPDTMTWDLEKINDNPYVVQFQGGYLETLFQETGGWIPLSKARELGLQIDFQGQTLMITIPRYVFLGTDYYPTLNETEVVVRLSSTVTEATINSNLDFVENHSTPSLEGANWELDPSQFGDKVDIIRQGGTIHGTKPGELKIEKVIAGTVFPIKEVEFTLTRKDGKDIEIREDTNDVNKGKSIILKTNDEGIATIKGLKPGLFNITETRAPEWINFNSKNPISKDFEIKSGDQKGYQFTIENEKKTIELVVEKKWKDSSDAVIDGLDTKIVLYQNNVPYSEEILLSKANLSHTFSNLERYDNKGVEYTYTVREVGENQNRISINGRHFKVTYDTVSSNKIVITNKEFGSLLPLSPSKTKLSVKKVWQGIASSDAPAVTVYLVKNGHKTDTSLVLNQANNWRGEFKDLAVVDNLTSEKANVYSVEEVKVDGFSTKVTGNVKDGFVVTNTKDAPILPLTPATTKVKVSKVWQGIATSDAPAVTVYLVKNGHKTDTSLVLNQANNWSGEFKDLAVVDNLTSEKTNVYSVEEVKVDGFRTKVTGNAKDGFVITNTKDAPIFPLTPATTNLKVSKVWQGIAASDAPAVTVYLVKNGQRTDTSLVLDKTNNWSGEFKNLAVVDNLTSEKANVYSVEEVKVDGFSTKVTGNAKDGFVITNTKNIPLIPLSPSSTKTKKLPKTGEQSAHAILLGFLCLSLCSLLYKRFEKTYFNQ